MHLVGVRLPDYGPAVVNPVGAAESSEAPDLVLPTATAVRSRRRRQLPVAVNHRAEPWILGLLGTAVVGSVLAVGAVHVPVIVATATLVIAAGVVAVWIDRDKHVGWPLPCAVLLLLAAYSAFQALPLPRALATLLAPHNVQSWDAAYELVNQPLRRFVPISLDPLASLLESLKWFVYATAFALAARVAHRREPTTIAALVFGSAALAAVSALGHRLLGATTLFGIYRPIYVTEHVIAPLLNQNNFAGYLNLGAFAGLGLMVARRPLLPRWVTALGVSVIIGISVSSLSRGGFAALMVGAIALIVLLRRRPQDPSRRGRTLLWLQGGAIVLGIVFFALSANRGAWNALVEEGLHKFSVIGWSRRMIWEHPLVGVGRGAFETTFPGYRQDFGGHIYEYAENFLTQWCSEWGVPVALSALAALFWLLRPAQLGTRRSALALSCAVGVATLLLQNVVDLALELTSVALAMFVLLGGLYGGAMKMRAQKLDTKLPLGKRHAPLLVGLAGAVLSLTSAVFGVRTAERDRREAAAALRRTVTASKDEQLTVLEDVRSAILRHPGDPYLPLAAAVAARRAEQNPLPWIGGSIERDPMAGRAHLLLASVMAEHGVLDQALLGVRMAVEREPSIVPRAAQLALSITRDEGKLRSAIPAGKTGAPMLLYLSAGLRDRGDSQLRERLLEESITRDPTDLRPQRTRLRDLLDAIEKGSEPCNGAGAVRCRERAERLIDNIKRLAPRNSLPRLAEARLALLDGRAEHVARSLNTVCPELDEGKEECSRLRFTAVAKDGDVERMDEAAASYLGIACSAPAPCETAAIWLGDRYGAAGLWGSALRMFERAARESESAAAWKRVAVAALRAGMASLAERALQRVKNAGGHVEPKLAQEVQALRQGRLNGLALPPHR